MGAYGGPRNIMRMISPSGPVYQAGTLSGNPVAVAAGIAQLDWLRRHSEIYAHLESLGARLGEGLNKAVPGSRIERVGSMLTLFFRSGAVRSWNEASRCDTARFARFHRTMLRRGIYLPPSQFEAWFISAAHRVKDIEFVKRRARDAVR